MMRRRKIIIGIMTVILSSCSIDVYASSLGYSADIMGKYVSWSGAFGVPDMHESDISSEMGTNGETVLHTSDLAIEYNQETMAAKQVYMLLLKDDDDKSHQIMKFHALVAALEFSDYPNDYSFFEAADMLDKTSPVFDSLSEVMKDYENDLLSGQYIQFYVGSNGTYYLGYNTSIGWAVIVK